MLAKLPYCVFILLLSILAACNQTNQSAASEIPGQTDLSPTVTAGWDYDVLIEQKRVGGYEIKLWGSTYGMDTASGYGRFTIERNGKILMIINEADTFRDAPAEDLTGEGNPDILLRLRRGGSHCCIGTVLMDLGPEPVEIIRYWSSIQGDWGLGEFVDLNDDGVYEIVTADAIEAPCTTPTVKVILQYQPGLGYQPVSPQFPEQYVENIEYFTGRLEEEFERDGGVHRCSIPQVAAAYYFLGRPEKAREIFFHYYTADNADSYWLELVEGFKNARFYTE